MGNNTSTNYGIFIVVVAFRPRLVVIIIILRLKITELQNAIMVFM